MLLIIIAMLIVPNKYMELGKQADKNKIRLVTSETADEDLE